MQQSHTQLRRQALSPLFLAIMPSLVLLVPGGTFPMAVRVPHDALLQQEVSTRIILTFSAKNEPVINGQLIPWNRLDQQIRAIYDLRPRKLLFVQPASSTATKVLDRVIQAAKKRGVSVEVLPARAS